jgi:thioredoxin reductase (NADPH)
MRVRPVLLVISDDHDIRSALVEDLDRRFKADYRGVACTAEDAVGVLARLVASGEEVALAIVDERLPGQVPVELLTRVHAVSPGTLRVLLVERGNWSAASPAVDAMSLGLIDVHLYSPWRPLEWILYPTVSHFLSTWDKTRTPSQPPIRVVGTPWAPRSHELRDAFTRVGLPFWFHDVDSDAGKALLEEVGADADDVPVVVHFSGALLRSATLAQVWHLLGVNTHVGNSECDVVVVGAGPAGLAASVYAASEGLHTILLEESVPGGQAGTSSLIRNYLGFQYGVSGDELTTRAVEQAWLFGVEFVLAQQVTGLHAADAGLVVATADGSRVIARAVVLAIGVEWRRLGVPSLEALVGAGVYYGAAASEARAMRGRDVFIVGAGNSAGQAAMHLARHARSVTMLARSGSLSASMSNYLVTEIEQSPRITVRLNTEVVDGGGAGRLETLTLKDRTSQKSQDLAADALFLMLGAEPRSHWLADNLQRDAHGFLCTGRDVAMEPSVDDASARAWPLPRPPLLLETSMPGVFAAGDVRGRSVKRVASAVGEGATAVRLIHEYLADM